MATKIFLVRHAAYEGDNSDPGLSYHGKKQALALANKIRAKINGSSRNTIIWTSSANRAIETAQIIRQEIKPDAMFTKEKLWCDGRHECDLEWLEGELQKFKGENLIIVSHLEYVRDLPALLGFSTRNPDYAEGVLIERNNCINL